MLQKMSVTGINTVDPKESTSGYTIHVYRFSVIVRVFLYLCTKDSKRLEVLPFFALTGLAVKKCRHRELVLRM